MSLHGGFFKFWIWGKKHRFWVKTGHFMSFLGQNRSFEVFFGQHLPFYVILHVSDHYREILLNHPVLGELLRQFNYVFNHVDFNYACFFKTIASFSCIFDLRLSRTIKKLYFFFLIRKKRVSVQIFRNCMKFHRWITCLYSNYTCTEIN